MVYRVRPVAALKSRPVYSFIHESVEQLASARPKLPLEELKKAVAEVLKLPARASVPDYRILRPRKGRDYPLAFASVYNIETEPGITAVSYRLNPAIHHARPPRSANRAILYVAHDSSDAERRTETMLREVLGAEPQSTLYTCDVRGLGESRPNTCGENSYHNGYYGCDYFYAAHSIMLDRPYCGQRTHDVLSVLDWIMSFGHRDVHVVARGYGAVPGAFAALLHDGATQVTLRHPLTSYAALATADICKWPLSSLTPNVLTRFDLPDVYKELATKKLHLIEPRGPEGART